MLVLGVALLAGFLFIGGGAAIYLSTPPQPAPTIPAFVADASAGPSLPPFVQDTPTPIITAAPTPTPFFYSPDPGSMSPGLYSAPPTFAFPTPTPIVGPTPTPPPVGPTPTPTPTPQPTPTPAPVVRSITVVQDPASLKVTFTAKVSGPVSQYQWDFGDGNGKTIFKPTITYTYKQPGPYTVTLILAGPGGTSAPKTKDFTVNPPATPAPTPAPTQPPPTPGPS